MLVKIQKVNSGVTFTVVQKDGMTIMKVPKTDCKTSREIARCQREASNWYRAEVIKALESLKTESENATLAQTGYGQEFIKTNYRVIGQGPCAFHIELNPWGFAAVNDVGGVGMNNSGSTPTPGRARILQAYQAPLEVHHEADGFFQVWIVKDF